LIPRRALPIGVERLSYGRGLVVNGPRQCGKSELLRLLHDRLGGTLASLDEPAQLRAARIDPTGFVSDRSLPLFVDEVQRGGDALVLALKVLLDESREPGQVVLAGSTRFLTEPRLSESLAGRVRFLDLWPLTQAEIDEVPTARLVELLLGPTSQLRQTYADLAGLGRREVYERVCRGGFPEAVLAPSDQARAGFFNDYVRTVSQRDITEIARIGQRVELPGFLRVLASRTGTVLNTATLAEAVGLSPDSVRRYLPLVETVFLAMTTPAWSRNVAAQLRRRPKVHLTDSGLAAALVGATPDRMLDPTSTITGQLLETFVVTELLKLTTWCDAPVALTHYRDADGREADVVLESPDGRVAAVEVKAAVDVDERDVRHLAYLRDRLGDSFANGVIVHCGKQLTPLGDKITALPVNALWT
jgi:predicted AAA+ superfamily ATPase